MSTKFNIRIPKHLERWQFSADSANALIMRVASNASLSSGQYYSFSGDMYATYILSPESIQAFVPALADLDSINGPLSTLNIDEDDNLQIITNDEACVQAHQRNNINTTPREDQLVTGRLARGSVTPRR
jgi:hypothetical protein